MKHVVKWMGAATLGFGLMSCSDNTVESKDLNVDSKGNLYVSVRDVNGTVLTAGDSVNVTLLKIEDKPRMADSLGTVLYKNLQVGSYQILVEKAGYAPMVCNTAISLAASDETPIASDVTLAVDLHKIGASVTGTAVRTNAANINGTETLPATDASMRLVLGGGACEYVNGTAVATVDASGNYSFADLPELANYTVYPQAMTVGTELNTANAIAGITGVVGENKKVAQLSYSVTADPFKVIATNKSSVAIDDSIVVNFSKSVDVARIRKGDIYVSNSVAIVPVWSNDNKTLTVKAATGKWNYGSTFNLVFTVYSVDGVSISTSSSNTLAVSIYTDGDLGQVVGVKAKDQMDTTINYNSTTVQLTWNKLANASGYEVYRKVSTDSSYVLTTTLGSINDTNVSVAGNVFSDGKSVQLLVVGVNSVGRSAFVLDSAKAFFDKVKPTQGLLYTNQGTATTLTTPGFSAQDWVFESGAASVTAGATNLELDQLNKMVIEFSEPMDTTTFTVSNNVVVTVSGSSNTSDKLTFTKAWSNSDSRLTLTPYVVANKSAADVALSVAVSFSGVTDKRGNVMATNSTGASVLFKHNTPVGP